METLAEEKPILAYLPHEFGQRQFHQSKHIIRACFPGNGWGKTRAAGSEVAWWLTRSHPYQKTPATRLIIIWCCETYKQFEILRQQLEQECFGPQQTNIHPWGWQFNQTRNKYSWQNGDQLFLVSGDSSWTHVQGINPDLVVMDEQPPEKMWAEFQARRRGRRKTRYIFAATATQGMTWMYERIYKPWLKYHMRHGIGENEAIQQQRHPYIWCWPRGGINDNPGADISDREWYAQMTFSSDAEREVRLFGGFRDFAGQPVFDQAGLEAQRPQIVPGRIGSIRNTAHRWLFDGLETPGGRIEVWEAPDPGERYVIGFDSAYGIDSPKSDFDYAVVLRRGDGTQVAEAQGKWGANWDQILEALHFYYRQAFLCGERQVGLMAMQRLWQRGIKYQYFQRDQADPHGERMNRLGHPRSAGDTTIPDLRKALGCRSLSGDLEIPQVKVRSQELLRQLCRFQFRSRSASVSIQDARDYQVQMSAPSGDHDDGVLALAYAWLGMREVPVFEPPVERPPSPDTMDWHPGDPLPDTSSDPFARPL
jgi:hypothetical protein